MHIVIFLKILWARMNVLFIAKVKILQVIKWSYYPPPSRSYPSHIMLTIASRMKNKF